MTVAYRDSRIKVGESIPDLPAHYLNVDFQELQELPFKLTKLDTLEKVVGEIHLTPNAVWALKNGLEQWLEVVKLGSWKKYYERHP